MIDERVLVFNIKLIIMRWLQNWNKTELILSDTERYL